VRVAVGMIFLGSRTYQSNTGADRMGILSIWSSSRTLRILFANFAV
jgi:hypothetical protein